MYQIKREMLQIQGRNTVVSKMTWAETKYCIHAVSQHIDVSTTAEISQV